MDDIETRVAAHELALIEVVAHIDRGAIAEGIVAISDGIVSNISDDERTIRRRAIALLQEAIHLYDAPSQDVFRPCSRAGGATGWR